MDCDDQVVPGGTSYAPELLVPSVSANQPLPHKGIPTKGGLRKSTSVTAGLAGYGIVGGNGLGMPGMGGMGGVMPQGMMKGVVPGGYGVVGMPYGYAGGIPAYGPGPYGYGCVGLAAQGVIPEQRKSVGLVEKLPEVTSGSKGKPRWSTPRRRGNWREKWGCAKDWGASSTIGKQHVREMCDVVRCAISDEISKRCETLGVGRPTVEKWLCLLAEYLELNGDEHVLLAILISRYGKGKRGWTGENDWCRPQRWECVVALAAYMAVLLSEEFPGKVAQDLQELLGRNFRFGKEQIAFLLALDWRINVDQEEFEHVQNLTEKAAKEIKGKSGAERMAGGNFKNFAQWFSGVKQEPVLNKPATPKAKNTVPIAPKFVSMSPITPEVSKDDVILGKKRSRDVMTPSNDEDELSVPGAKRHARGAYGAVGIVPSVEGWAF